MRRRPWIGFVPVHREPTTAQGRQPAVDHTQIVTPPEVHQSLEILRLTAVLAELRLVLETFDPGDVCLREWDVNHACPCRLCAARRIVRYA